MNDPSKSYFLSLNPAQRIHNAYTTLLQQYGSELLAHGWIPKPDQFSDLEDRNSHLTIRYLGQLDTQQIEYVERLLRHELRKARNRVSRKIGTIQLLTDGVMYLRYNSELTSCVWNVNELGTGDKLPKVRQIIDGILDNSGDLLPEPKHTVFPLKPHITIAIPQKECSLVEELPEEILTEEIPWDVTEIEIIESEKTNGKSVYSVRSTMAIV